MLQAQLYYSFEGFAVVPEDIQFGDLDSQEVLLLRKGVLTKVSIARKSVTITLRGLKASQAQPYVRQAQKAPLNLIRGHGEIKDLVFGILTIEDALLMKAIPSIPIQLNGQALYESLQLEYHSQKYV